MEYGFVLEATEALADPSARRNTIAAAMIPGIEGWKLPVRSVFESPLAATSRPTGRVQGTGVVLVTQTKEMKK
jgi:hypothetical protein